MAVWPGLRSITAGERPLVPLGCMICIDGKPGGGATRGYRLPQDQHFNRIKGESWEPGEERRGEDDSVWGDTSWRDVEHWVLLELKNNNWDHDGTERWLSNIQL